MPPWDGVIHAIFMFKKLKMKEYGDRDNPVRLTVLAVRGSFCTGVIQTTSPAVGYGCPWSTLPLLSYQICTI